MMKKAMMMVLMSLLLVGTALAQGQIDREATHAQVKELLQTYEQEQLQFRNSSLEGLERAQIMVQNEVAAQRIEANLERVQARERLMLRNLSQIRLLEGTNDTVVVQGEGEARLFGIIKTNRAVTFIVDDQGDVERVGRPFDFLFRYREEIRNIEQVGETSA